VVAYVDSLSFNKTIQAIKNHTKFNSSKILEKHKVMPKNKTWMVISLCQMISMSIVRPILKIDILKME
jgi:hypothetical protein